MRVAGDDGADGSLVEMEREMGEFICENRPDARLTLGLPSISCGE